MKLTLQNGLEREYSSPLALSEIAASICPDLAKQACAGRVDGKTVDLRTVVGKDAQVEILTFADPEGKKAFRHTASHILAQAVKRLYPGAKLAIGPAIDDGFYYDFDLPVPLTESDLPNIEAEMKKIIRQNLPLECFSLSREEALVQMREEPYKTELIEALPKESDIRFYRQGDFTDLCAGPHLSSTGQVKAIKLTSVAGAYWHGDEKNKMLTRIYGTAFPKNPFWMHIWKK